MTGNGQLALRYARAGRPVLPLHSPTLAGGCSCGDADCGSPAKHPRTVHGVHDASRESRQVAAWWSRWPDANVGLATGRALVVIDIDGAVGQRGLDELQARHGVLPITLTASTGSGEHRYFIHHNGVVVNSAGRLGDRIDVRGEHGYVVAPPSTHHTGRRYRWTESVRPQELPAWVATLLARDPLPGRAGIAPVLHPDHYFAAALEGELHEVSAAATGARNDTLNRAAFRLGQLIAAGQGDRSVVIERLHHAAVDVGLGEGESAATIRSGLRAGERLPRLHAPR